MRALLVHAHPRPDSFTAAMRDAALRGLGEREVDVDVIDLWVEGFDPLDPGPVMDAGDHLQRLRAASALVLVYPTWWSGQPAILLGWLSALPTGALDGIERITAVTAHGSSRWINRLEGETGLTILRRTVRPRCARGARVDWVAMYSIDRADEQARTRFLARVERHFSST